MNEKFELNEMELDTVSGGRPRIKLFGPRHNSLQVITKVVHTVKDLIVKNLKKDHQEHLDISLPNIKIPKPTSPGWTPNRKFDDTFKM